MPDKFNMQAPPFDRLNHDEQTLLRTSLDVAYYRVHDVILAANKPSQHLHIMIKGAVEERSADGQEVFAHYAHDDLFDARGMLEDTIKHQYVALEDTLSYLLPKAIFLQLYHANSEFAAYFDSNLAKRQALIETAQRQQNLAEFILTKVDDSIYHPALIVPAQMSLQHVTKTLKEQGIDAALVQLDHDDPRCLHHPEIAPYAIITRTNLLHAVMLESRAMDSPVSDIASFPVRCVAKGDFLFHAMVTMTRHKMKRLMVHDQQQAVGMLDMTQILSAFSTHSHVLTLRIARATCVEELAMASNKQRQLVESLLNHGIRTRFIMELIAAVNEQIIEKAFQLVVPKARHSSCCLLVLGSEGRGEQVLKTDQDNALILQDNLDWPELPQVMEQLTLTLQQLGYPLCPGHVMVNNPAWVQSQSDWQSTLLHWQQSADGDSLMKLAMFADAHSVAGNKALLCPIKHNLMALMKEQTLLLSHFTRPALSFSSPLTLFGNVKADKTGLNIKQSGIFPIVHGVRALSLEFGLLENNTFERIHTLVQRRVLESETAENLSEALKLFFKLRLAQQLQANPVLAHDHIEVQQLDRTERDLLRHSLHVVKKFKQWLSYHYQIRD